MKIIRLLFLFLFSLSACAPSVPLETQTRLTWETIESTYQSRIRELSPAKRGHWYVRLYRMSGNSQYLPEIQKHGRSLVEKFRKDAALLSSKEYRGQRAALFLTPPKEATSKKLHRVHHLKKWAEMAFANRLMFAAFQIKSLGLDRGELQEDFNRVLAYLRNQPFKDYILDPKAILYDGSHTTNAVFYLKYLGLGDYEDLYTEKFRQLFFQTGDASLSKVAFSNKIYGLTHFIIAGSYFYQQEVSAEKHGWILDYFSENFGEIQYRSSPDLIAELAVCFKLAGKKDAPLVRAVHKILTAAFDPKQGIIPLSLPGKNLNDTEHRNIMSVMALKDFPRFYPGPDLNPEIPSEP